MSCFWKLESVNLQNVLFRPSHRNVKLAYFICSVLFKLEDTVILFWSWCSDPFNATWLSHLLESLVWLLNVCTPDVFKFLEDKAERLSTESNAAKKLFSNPIEWSIVEKHSLKLYECLEYLYYFFCVLLNLYLKSGSLLLTDVFLFSSPGLSLEQEKQPLCPSLYFSQ